MHPSAFCKEFTVKTKIPPKSLKTFVVGTLAGIALVSLVGFKLEAVKAFLEFVRDRQAVIDYLDPLGITGPLVLMGLVALQVLIPSLPSEPPMLAGAYVYGFASGFLMNWIVTVAASQAVFYLARYAGRPVVERLIPSDSLYKWTRLASEKGTLFFALAFMIPPVPSDIMIYVAGLSAIKGRSFFVANLIGRIPLIALFSWVGASGFSVTPVMLIGFSIAAVIMFLAWWFFIFREPRGAMKLVVIPVKAESS
jgi:uncharacterized membrane protein YdjX (TVP38/TMEM64 family)